MVYILLFPQQQLGRHPSGDKSKQTLAELAKQAPPPSSQTQQQTPAADKTPANKKPDNNNKVMTIHLM